MENRDASGMLHVAGWCESWWWIDPRVTRMTEHACIVASMTQAVLEKELPGCKKSHCTTSRQFLSLTSRSIRPETPSLWYWRGFWYTVHGRVLSWFRNRNTHGSRIHEGNASLDPLLPWIHDVFSLCPTSSKLRRRTTSDTAR